MEILSVEALPEALSVAISNKPFPTGEEIIKGVKDELASILSTSLPIAIR